MVERTIAWLVAHGNRRVRYRGIAANQLWLVHRAAAVNLKRLARLGLALPLRERLELDFQLDDDLILTPEGRSLNKGDSSRCDDSRLGVRNPVANHPKRRFQRPVGAAVPRSLRAGGRAN